MVIKCNKQQLIMEEVEQFDNISIEELAEGYPSSISSLQLINQLLCRVTGEFSSLCRSVL